LSGGHVGYALRAIQELLEDHKLQVPRAEP
jgi:hypothetical protein